jgi:integrase
MSVKRNFTKKYLDSLPPRDKRYTEYDHVNGLGLLVQPTGHKAFFWFRKVRGFPTWRTIGDFPDLSIERARARASEMNAAIADWKARHYDGPNPLGQPEREPTLNDAIEDYCMRRLASHAKNPDRACYGVRWSRDKYLTGWKTRRLSSITRKNVIDLHEAIGKKHGKVTANRVVTLLRTVYNWAQKSREWKGENPASRIAPFAEKSRERFLQPGEMAALLQALSVEPNRDLRDFVVLSLLTGARMSDVLACRWDCLSFETASWRIPNPKSKRPYTVPLMPEAIEILQNRTRSSPWVFPSTGTSGHLVSLKRGWQQLRNRIKLPDLRIHDLRRTMGSWQAAEGISLPIIGATLGHQSSGSTQVYARLQLDTVRDAMKRATQRMLTTGAEKSKESDRG